MHFAAGLIDYQQGRENDGTKRHSDAIAISDGACNPSGIAHAIIAACTECRETTDFRGTAQLCEDPAIRLMVHQLAFLVGVGEFQTFDWNAARETCKEG